MYRLNLTDFYQTGFRIEVLLRLPDLCIQIDIQRFACFIVIPMDFSFTTDAGKVIQLGIGPDIRLFFKPGLFSPVPCLSLQILNRISPNCREVEKQPYILIVGRTSLGPPILLKI